MLVTNWTTLINYYLIQKKIMSKLVSINPSNYQVLGEVEISEKKEIQEKVNLAGKAQKKWSMLSIHKRVSQLSSLLPLFEKKREELSILAAREMGMPLTQARSDFDYGIKFLEWYFENVSKYLEPEITYQNNFEVCKVHYEPIGVVAAIVPWNYPFSNFVWQAGQNLVVGNAVIFKYSEEIPLFSKEIERTFSESEVMEGVFSQVYGNGAVGWDLVNQEIDLICFTGSTKTGKELYKLAGERSIPAKLELGGSAPGIVFADADIDKAIETIFENRFGNNGQMCDGLKRLIVHKSKYNEVVTKLKEVLESKNIGDPLDGKTDIGPLSAKRQLEPFTDRLYWVK
jgi:acyl-CoA reductase-like NAD-dependent aldehyde dehydrogenase